MPITFTMDDGVNPPTESTLPDETVASIEQYRQTLTHPNENMVMVEDYATIKDLIIGTLAKYGVMPALLAFPTPAMQAAKDLEAQAAAAKVVALMSALPGFGT